MALHTGENLALVQRRCERLCEVANEGQTLVSAQCATELQDVDLYDLGLHRLRDLAAAMRVFSVDSDAPPRSLNTIEHNLPVQATSFVGRRAEAEAIRRLLVTDGIVTLTGPGGGGKTRLAAQIAAADALRWPDGVWWVELATVSGDVAETVAAATNVLVDPGVGALRSLTSALGERKALVCLDNCEHVLDSAAELVAALARDCPEVTVLATSQEPLGLANETVWRVPPLAGDEAMALFLERAATVRPGITVDNEVVRTLCQRLDGIPLALELAAAWLRTLTPEQIEAGLADRFGLLVRGPRGLPPRQQTLLASVEWSHALLDPADQVVLRRLAVFAGTFTVAAAQAAATQAAVTAHTVGDGAAVQAVGDCDGDAVGDRDAVGEGDGAEDAVGDRDAVGEGDVLVSLGRLVDKSLVVAEESRYRLLETIRLYALDRLAEAGETEVTRDRHLAYYLRLATDAEPELDRDRDAWRAIVEPELDNIRAALDHGLVETSLRRPPYTTLNTERFRPRSKFPEPNPNPCERAIRTGSGVGEQGRELAASVAWLWNLRARGREGMTYLRRALDLAPDDRSVTQVRLLVGIAEVADTTSPYENFAQQALAIATDPKWRARCLGLLALEKMIVDFDAAADLCLEAEKDGDDHTRDSSQVLRGLILHVRDQHDEALALLATAVKGLADRAERGIAATASGYMSLSALYTGDLANAREWALRAVDLAEPMGDYHRVGVARSQLAFVHMTAGEMDAAWAVITPVMKVAEQAFVPGLARTVGELHYREERFDQAHAWFQRDLPLTESWITAINGPSLGKALRGLDRSDEAAEVLDRTLDLARKGRMPRIIADTLEQQAYLTGSVDLHHEALAIRVEHGLRAYVPDSLDALAALQAKPDLAAAAAAARVGGPGPVDDVMSLEEAVAYVRRSRGSRGRPTSGWDSLTPTEREVVRLAVEGLNNPEIGARLFMSRGTVKTHLSHVYAKLGVSNRTELATLAAAHPR
jgi:predicted ATPase/DNA-binding CsgD family transcriptional regulator